MKKLLVLCLCLCLVFSLSACKSNDYEKAKGLYDSGNYAEALPMFEELGDYEDSEYYVNASKYEMAKIERANGNYDEAIAILEELGDFNDSPFEIQSIEKEKITSVIDKNVDEVFTMIADGNYQGALSKVESYLLITEYEGLEYPYAERFTERAKELLNEDYSMAYAIAKRVAQWGKESGNPTYNPTALSTYFPKIKWMTYDVGDTLTLGKCIQDNEGSKKDIEWVIIAKEDDRMLLLSKKGLRRATRTESYKQNYLQNSFTNDELNMIGSLDNITELSLADYEKYKSVIDANPCIATYWAFMEKQSGVYQVHSRHQWQIDKLDSTPVCWYISDDKIVDKDGSRFAIAPSEVYCRPSVWVSIK